MTMLNSTQSAHRAGIRQRLLRRTALGGALLIMAHAGAAGAMPKFSGVPAMVAHAPVITTPNANSTNVTLNQARTLIDWSSFNLAQGQQVDFLFKSNNWIVLNRVLSVAHINGGVMGCVMTCGAGGAIGGNVWFYSPAGVIFGPHAQVNVGGLLATTSPLLSEADFLNGANLDFKFGGGSPDARVVVQSGAQLNALGSLALIAPSVFTEAGSNLAAGGTALYGAAQNYVIHFDESAGHGLNLLDFEVPASALSDGTISATPLSLGGDTAAGKVLIASVSRPSVVRAVISLGGMVTASSASDAGGGDILLSASGAPAAVEVGGDLRASHNVSLQAQNGGSITVTGAVSASAGGAGGTISLGGKGTNAVDLAAGARLDASSIGAGLSGGSVVLTAGAVQVDGSISATGRAGGGVILVGGGAQGRDAGVANAATTDIGSGAVLDASAIDHGDGGRVVVWSDQSTAFRGTILSRGGASGGAGGAAEVSSAGRLSYAGAADLRAADGSAGQLLLDPSELTVIPTGGSGVVAGGVNTPATSAASTIGADVIDTALLSADVTISTHMSATGGDGVIAFNGGAGPLALANTGSTPRTLSFVPENGFLFTTGVATKGPLNLTLNAGASPINLPGSAGVIVTDGDLTLIGSNLSLLGDLTSPHISLTATGSISQSGGVITTGKLVGSSGASTSLLGANLLGGLQDFTAGAGLTVSNAADLSANNVSAGSGALALTTTSGALTINGVSAGTSVNLTAAGNLNLVGDLTGSATALSAGGEIDQVGGVITASALSASASNGISLTGPNAVGGLGSFTNTGSGGVAFADNTGFTLSGDINAPGQSVSLVTPNGSISQMSGVINANMLTAAARGGVSLTDANVVPILGGLVSSSAGPIAFVDAGSFTITGDIAASGQTASLVSSGGAINQANGVITAASFSASAASGLSLNGANEIPTVTALSSGAGGLSFNDNQTATIAAITLGGGDLSLSTTSGDLVLTGAVSSPGALTLSSARAVSIVSASAVGDYSVTGVAINTPALQPTLGGPASNLSIDFTNTLGTTNLSSIALSAPGSITLAAHDNHLEIGSITAGANVTISTTGSLSEGDGGVTAATLTASAVNGLDLDGSNTVSTVTSLTNTISGGLNFSNNKSVTIASVNQGGAGSINLNTSAGDLTLTSALTSPYTVSVGAANNLTVDGITAPNGVALFAGGALTETAGATISTGYNYTAQASTMNAAAEQPVFTTSFGNLSLTFNQTGGLTDLSGTPLSAPQSVSVSATNESLTVDSITSGANVTLSSGGVLSAASSAKINLTGAYYYDYSATAVSVNLANPAIVQPIFGPGSLGSLRLNFTQSGGTIDLTGVALSAPQSVSVQASSANLTVDAITAGGSVNLSSGNALTTVGPTTAAQTVTFQSGGAMTVDSIASGSNVDLYATTGVLSAASGATINVFGAYYIQVQSVSLTNPVIVQPTFTNAATGILDLTFTQSGGLTDLSSTTLSAPEAVNLTLTGNSESLKTGAINAGSGGVSLSAIYYLTGDSFTVGSINTPTGDVSASTGFYNGGALTVVGPVVAGGAVSLATGIDSSGALTTGPITAGGAVTLDAGTSSSGVLTVNSITAASGVTLDAGGALLSAVGGPPVTVKTGGTYSATGATIDPILFQPTFTGSFGDLDLNFTGSGGTANLTLHPLSAPMGSISVSANSENLTVDGLAASSSGGNITLSANGALMSVAASPPTLGGSYSATGDTIAAALYQPTFTAGSFGSLNLDFTGSGGGDLTGFHLTAPGSVSVSAPSGNLTVDSITAGGDVSLNTGGALQTPVSTPVTISVSGSYSATGSTITSSLFEPAFVGSAGDLSLTFNGFGGAILSGTPLSAPGGSVSVSAPVENLTVDAITAAANVTLSSGGALAALTATGAPASIHLGGSYNATGNTIDPSAFQPTFTGSTGDLSLTFNGSGGAILTSLSAPGGSVSVSAPFENLTVGSINAGANVTLNTGLALVAAGGATINLLGDYSATAQTISAINPVVLQPHFMAGSVGGLSLTFTQSGGAIDLTGTPLTAPGTVSVSVSGSAENLTVDTITATGGDVDLSAAYYGNTGTLTAGTVHAGGSVNMFTGVYYGGALTTGSINASGGVSLSTGYYSGGALTAGPITAGGAVSMTAAQYSGGVLTVGAIAAGSDVNLTAGGALMTTDASAPVVTLGGSYAATALTIDPRLYQPMFTPGSTGSLSLTFRQTGGTVDLTGSPLSAPSSISLTSSEGLTIDSLTATGQLSLSASGALTEDASSVITAGSLNASATSGIVLNGANAVADINSLYNSGTGGISFTDVGNLVLNGYVTAYGQTVNFVSNTGSISETGYYYYDYVTADTLTASAATGITLTNYNNVSKLGPTSNSTSGGINFNSVSDLTLVGNVSAPGQTVNLTTFGGLHQTAGAITAGVLTASASTGIAFNDANLVTSLGALTNAYTGGVSFTNNGDLALTGNLTAFGQTVNVASDTGAVSQTGGVVFAATLTGSAANGFTLNGANAVTFLGAVSNSDTGGISVTNATDLTLIGDISASGQQVSLVSTSGALRQASGAITAGTLNLSAVTGIDFSDANFAAQLGTIGNTTSGDVAFVNDGDFTLTGAITALGQNVSLRANSGAIGQSGGAINANTLRASAATGLSLTGANQVGTLGVLENGAYGGIAYTSAGAVTLTTDLNGFGEAVSLTALSGAVTQSAEQTLTAGTLNLAATTGLTLGNTNAVTHLGVVNNTAGGVSLNDAVSLSLTGAVQASGQAVSLTGAGSVTDLGGGVTANTLSVSAVDGISLNNESTAFGILANSTTGGISVSTNTGDLQLTTNISAPGQSVQLSSKNGAVNQTGGIITAGVLNASGATGVSLGDANQVAVLGILFNSTSGGIAVTSVSGIDLRQAIDAPGQTVSLTSQTGALTQSAGEIAASTLNASAATGVTLTGENLVANLGALSNTASGGISYLSAGDPFLTGAISAPGQAVTLTAPSGSFTQNAGVITAGVLNVSAANGITLNDANAVSSLGTIINSGSGGVSFTNAGDLALTGPVLAVGQAVALTSNGGSINQSGGSVNAQDITLDAAAAMNLINVTASNQATITASTLSLTTPVDATNALQAPTLVIESRTGQIDIGDGLVDPSFTGMTLSGATLHAFNTASVSFYAGYFKATDRLTDLAPEASVGIKVGDISADFKGLGAPAGGATASLFAGPSSTVEVLGSVTSTMPGLGHIIIGDKTADTWTPKAIDVSGSIGANGTTLAVLNSVELNATGDVLMGDSKFQAAITSAEAAGQTDLININSGEPPGVTQTGTGAIFIGSNTLTLRAQGVIVSQNTGATGDFAGISLPNGGALPTVLTLGTTQATAKNTPLIIDIFATLNDASGMAVTGMALAPSSEIALEAPLTIGNAYRTNGCVVGETGACNILTVATLPTKLIQGVTLSTAASSDSDAETAAVARVYSQIPLIPMKTVTPVGDPTITGVGNEEIWRDPSCDPRGDKPCP